MPVPSTRTPVRVARGTYANLSTVDALASLQEGEVCFATDQQKLYVKQGGGLTSISASSTASPAPSDFTASPAFVSGTGTQADPFVVTSAAVPFSGGTTESAQEITLTGTAGDFVIFTDNSVTASGDRFSGQVVGNVDSGGTFTFKLKYEDAPGTTVDNTTYNGVLQIGTTYFSFTVVQSNLTALSESSASSIAGTGGVGNVLTCTPGTATGGTGTITYATQWQRSFNGIDGFFNINGATGNTYTQTNSDAGNYVRAVVTATDATPAGQGGPLTLELPSGVTTQIPTGAAPVINNIVLSEDDTTGARFTSKVFSADFTMGNDGSPTSQKSIKGTVTANFENFPSTDSVSSTSNNIDYDMLASNASYASSHIATTGWWAPCGILLEDHDTTMKISLFHTTSSSSGNAVNKKEFNIGNGSLTSTNDGFQHSYSSRIQRAGAFNIGVDPDGRKYIHWGCANDYSSGTTYYYADPNTSPSYRQRAFEFTASNGAHFYSGNSYGNRYILRKLPGESSYEGMYLPVSYNYHYYNTACEFNGKIFYVWNDSSSSVGRWVQLSTDASGWTADGNIPASSSTNGSVAQSTWDNPQCVFVHKNTVFLQANWRLFKYNPSSNNWTQITNSNWTGGGEYIYQTYQDDTYLYVQSSNQSANTRWWRSNNLGVTWVQDVLGSGYGESYYACSGNPQNMGGSRLKAFGWDMAAANYNTSWGHIFNYRQFNQVVVTFASDSQLSNINPGDFMRVSGETDAREYAYVQSVNASSNQLTLNMNTNPTSGQTMETLASTGSSSATKYLVISSTGNITGYQGSDPGFVEISPGTEIDLTFPATFPSGNAPDDEFAAGTVMQVTGKATNASASDTFNSNQVTPN